LSIPSAAQRPEKEKNYILQRENRDRDTGLIFLFLNKIIATLEKKLGQNILQIQEKQRQKKRKNQLGNALGYVYYYIIIQIKRLKYIRCF